VRKKPNGIVGTITEVASIIFLPNDIISVYGGLVIFGGFLLYDTQRIVKSAENHPYYAVSDVREMTDVAVYG
jgi:FtsH-binding integral membrane protein